MNRFRKASLCRRISCLSGAAIWAASATIGASPAEAQLTQPAVNACSGLRLPRSAITDVLGPVANGIAAPLEDRVNSILDVIAIVPLVGQVLPPLDTNVSGLLSSAADGDPIALQIVDTDGNVVDPDAGCTSQADSFSLSDAGGISIGGNRIAGLGAEGAAAAAGEINSIAFGNGATTDAAAAGAVAIGTGASVTAANSVAIGSGSVADRGPRLAYAAIGLPDTQLSAGEFSVGAAGSERQITHVAAGSAPTDAVNVAQLQGVADEVANHETRIAALEAGGSAAPTAAVPANGPVRYADAGNPTTPNDGTATNDATLSGAAAGPVGLHNVRDGALAAGSTDAVNGSQLNATNVQVAANTTQITQNSANIASNSTRIDTLVGSVSGSTVVPVQYADAATPTAPNGGTITNDVTLIGASAGAVGLHNVADGRVAAGSTDAVNGGQLNATNQALVQVAAVADEAVALGRNSVQYDGGGTSVTLGAADGPAVALHNVADGVAPGDAANVGQLNAGMQSALADANAYTDLRIDMIGQDFARLRRESNAGTAGALAAAALPQATDAGRGMVGLGFGTFQGQSAFALGLSARTRDGRATLRAGATVDTRGRAGANAGVGIQF
jgi:autotransporter adhesin